MTIPWGSNGKIQKFQDMIAIAVANYLGTIANGLNLTNYSRVMIGCVISGQRVREPKKNNGPRILELSKLGPPNSKF